MNAPLITVVIPFQNNLDYLRQAIESVVGQTSPHWRLIVCGDAASQFGALPLVTSFQDPRVTAVQDRNRLNIAEAFNRGLDLAGSEMVTLLHQDDRLMPNYVKTMMTLSDCFPEAVGCFCRSVPINDAGRSCRTPRDRIKGWLEPRPVDDRWILRGPEAVAMLLRVNFIVGPTMCFRKSLLRHRRFDVRWKQVLDLALHLQLLIDGETLVGTSEPGYHYRRHGRQTTAIHLRELTFFTEQILLFDELEKQSQSLGHSQIAHAARAKRIITLDLCCQIASDLYRCDHATAISRVKLLCGLICRSRP